MKPKLLMEAYLTLTKIYTFVPKQDKLIRVRKFTTYEKLSCCEKNKYLNEWIEDI